MFSIIQDSVDTNINIVRHNRTGNYNVTKTLKQYKEIYGIKKLIGHWNDTQNAKDTKAAAIAKYGSDAIYEILDVDNDYKGTYVNHILYRTILMWADLEYAFRIFDIIEQHQHEHETKLNFENNAFQSTIKALFDKIDGIAETNNRLEKKADTAEFNLKEMSTKMNSKLDKVVGMLQEKSIVSTMNPTNPKLHHNFVIMGYKFTDQDTGKLGWVLSFIAGQELNVKKAIRAKYADENHGWIIVVQMHYNANPIDLRNNIETKVKEFVANRVMEVNEKELKRVTDANLTLKEDIRLYMNNKSKDDPKRRYSEEKEKFIRLASKDVPITCKKTRAVYIGNDYVSYDEFLQSITAVNKETQASPYQSDETDEFDNSDDIDYTDDESSSD